MFRMSSNVTLSASSMETPFLAQPIAGYFESNALTAAFDGVRGE